LPPSIGSLTAVRNLGLSDNQFTGTIPPSYENLNVMNFGAANNNLSGPVPEFLTKFTGIFLNDNDFEGCIPEVFLESCGGLVLDNNPKLSFGGDTEPFCNGESQGGASCDDGNPLTINDALNDACECVGIVPSCENEDAIALTILYNQLGGEDWTNQEGWAPELTNDNCDPCGWFGVNCNDEGEVIGLELVSNNLVGELTNDISRLTSLRDLNLGSNGITGSLPDSLSLINSLRTVSLDSNSITGGIPADYENLNIDIFSAVNNDLSGCYPAGLTTWCESQVDFSGNNQLPWLGNFSTFCDGEEQVGAACRVQTIKILLVKIVRVPLLWIQRVTHLALLL
jgi:Leucine Rich Repeat.